MFKKLILAALVTGLSSPAIANDETDSQTQLGFTVGLMNGGDDIGGLIYEDGESVKVSAGGLMSIGASIRTIYNDSFTTKFNAKYEFDSAIASNAEATFSRFAVDALAGYQLNENVTLYGGVTYHFSPKYSEEDDYSNFDSTFSNTLGLVIEAAYNMTDDSELRLRYVNAEYELESFKINTTRFSATKSSNSAIDASSIGLFWSTFF